MDDAQRREQLACLQLIRTPGIGPITFAQLIERAGSAAEAVLMLPGLAEAAGRKLQLTSAQDAEREWRRGVEAGFSLLTLSDSSYPDPLRAITDAPPALWLFGDDALLHKPMVSIVGARNASAAGRRITADLSAALGEAGYVVVSGMARGIDGAAHHAALGKGTVAVLAGGTDNVYPAEHRGLYEEIGKRGLVLSEQPLGMIARAQDFPKRNRIVSGLSSGIIVIEAAEKSGTLITARLASEQGRDVFAVPGSPLDPRSKGTNGLLKKGAIMVETADDVISELRSQRIGMAEPSVIYDEGEEVGPGDARERLLELLSYTPTHRDSLIAESGLSAAAAAHGLLDLVLEGQVQEEAGGLFTLV